MLRRRAWGMSAALVAALGGAVTAAGPGDTGTPPYERGNAAFHRWNGGVIERPKPPPPPIIDRTAQARAKDTAAALRAQEEANLLRRLAACDQLRRFALETGDESLEKLADELQREAMTVFEKRAAALSGSQLPFQAEPRPSDAPNPREGK